MLKKIGFNSLLAGCFCGAVLWEGQALPAFAQTADDQIEALGHVQDAQDAQRLAVQRAQQEAHAKSQARIAARQRAAQQAARARAAAREKQARAAEQEKTLDRQAKREYEQALREIEIEKKRARLELDIAKAKHSEDYVKADLDKKRSETDSVSARSEAVRSLSSGGQHLLEDAGKAQKMSQRHWWESKD
ncbi:DUF5384 family protein [Aristophania vespae]|uniref:DUF5384 family protein n=1 Tax=Aristophania vespae TaxID=2697033 RepID=UPI0023512DA9|nr:DUF5384 family protein [Aristophania vespae]UMM64191.1 hypothetical protein DM15PD_11920 [Aristophania vespae]